MRHTIKCFLPFIFVLLYAVTALAQFSIYSHNNVSTDDCWVQPCIRIQNISSNWLHLKDYTIEYYFYDPDHSANQYTCDVWYFSNGSSRAYTSFEDYPPFTNGDKKANIKCVITFSTSNYNILYGNGNYDELELGIRYAYSWNYVQNQSDDWSYVAGQSWQTSENIVVKDDNGNIVFGNEPGSNVQKPDPVPMNWLGLIDDVTFQEIQDADLFDDGDAYKNSDNNKSYVRYKDEWQEIAGGSGSEEYKNGFTMNSDDCDIDMTGSDLLDVNTLETIDIETSFLRMLPWPSEKPAGEFDQKGREGDICFYEDNGEWYLYIKVDGDPHEWKRVKLIW